MSQENPKGAPQAGILRLGPGPRMARLEPLLGALGAQSVDRLGDLDALLGALEAGTRVLLDLSLVESEDGGILRRFLKQHPQCRLELIGGDPTRGIVQSLTLDGRASWSPWPLDTDRLAHWARGTQASLTDTGGDDSSDPRPATRGQRDSQVLAIERILGDEPSPEEGATLKPFDTRASAAADPDVEPPSTEEGDFGAGLASKLTEPPAQARSPAGALPLWYRDQVADLADMAQRLDLGLRRTLEASEEAESDDALRALSEDVLRLGQFTRTIGFLAAPPGPDGSTVDLSELAQDYLSSLAHEEDGGPKYLFRAAPDAIVRGEKSLLILSIDAIVTVASLAAGSEAEVKVGVSVGTQDASLEVIFPAGPLGDLEPAQWLVPYALHRLLPGVGPNAIPAAAAILAGQGGQLSISADKDERLFRLELPLA